MQIELRDFALRVEEVEPQEIDERHLAEINAQGPQEGWSAWSARISEDGRAVYERRTLR